MDVIRIQRIRNALQSEVFRKELKFELILKQQRKSDKQIKGLQGGTIIGKKKYDMKRNVYLLVLDQKYIMECSCQKKAIVPSSPQRRTLC